jgi:signal peptidase I
LIKNKKVNAYYRKIFKNEFFMLGDNRDNANDSRFWGTVKISQLYAKPLISLFPYIKGLFYSLE